MKLEKKMLMPLSIATLALLIWSSVPSVAATTDTTPELTKSTNTFEEPEAQTKKKGMLAIFPSASLYYPTNSKTTDRFGSGWGNIGLSLKLTTNYEAQDQFGVGIENIRRSNDNGHLCITPVTFNYTHHLSKIKGLTPYVGAGISSVFASVMSRQDKIDTGTRLLPAGSLYAGVRFGRTGYIQATYNSVSRIRDFNLSGVSVTAGLGF